MRPSPTARHANRREKSDHSVVSQREALFFCRAQTTVGWPSVIVLTVRCAFPWCFGCLISPRLEHLAQASLGEKVVDKQNLITYMNCTLLSNRQIAVIGACAFSLVFGCLRSHNKQIFIGAHAIVGRPPVYRLSVSPRINYSV